MIEEEKVPKIFKRCLKAYIKENNEAKSGNEYEYSGILGM